MRLTFLGIGILIFFTSLTSVATLPKEERVPGGIALIRLPQILGHPPKAPQNGHPPKVTFNGESVALIQRTTKNNQKQWIAVVGIPLNQKPGSAELRVMVGVHLTKIPFQVKDKAYKLEKLFFKQPKQSKNVKPNLKVLERLERERRHFDRLFSIWTPTTVETFKMTRPVPGRVTGTFGNQRMINGVLASQHKGIDFSGKVGTPIHPTLKGKVIDVGQYLLTGNTVMLDHGQGLKTVYAHLSTVKVKPGDLVSPKSIIGTVGKTGRATGPHLHFGVNLNNTRVAPELFFVN